MICPYCGKENPPDTEICEFCGGPLITQPAEPVEEITPPEPPVEVLQGPTELVEPTMTPVTPAPPPSGSIYGNKIWWIVGCFVFICLVLACIAAVLAVYRSTKLLNFLNPTQEIQAPLITQALVETPLPVLPAVETSTPDSTTELLPRQTGTVLFFDDFSDPSSGWDQVEETNYSTNYYNDTYRIKIDVDLSDSWANPSDLDLSDVILEVDATKNGGPDDNDFGLICRYQGTEHFYYAVISSDGYYAIFKVTPESTDILGREQLDFSELIQQGSVTNTIRFECVGNTLTLYVNRQLLDQQNDSEYSSGNVGLIAGTYDTPGTDILFDNFAVYSP